MVSTKAIAVSILTLRIFTLLCLVGCVVVIATDNYKLSYGPKELFQDVHAYRYVLATAAIGSAYTLLQIPLSLYRVCTEKSSLHDGFLIPFDFYADKIITFLLATGVGAGFAVSIESKRFVHEVNKIYVLFGVTDLDEWRSKLLNFFDRGIIASAILLLGFISMALISILTSINLNTKSSGRQGFFLG